MCRLAEMSYPSMQTSGVVDLTRLSDLPCDIVAKQVHGKMSQFQMIEMCANMTEG